MSRFAHITALFLFFSLILGTIPAGRVFAVKAGESDACNAIVDPGQKQQCNSCMGSSNPGAWTALGCITTDPQDLLGKVLGLGIGMAGGIAFLLIIFGGLQIMTSAGNPEQLNAGRELVSSAVTGLLLIIFSIFLLQFIGVNIIGIPGFG